MSPSRIPLWETRARFVISTVPTIIVDRSTVDRAIINRLSDNILLEIFHFCRLPDPPGFYRFLSPLSRARSWVTLIQVCQRWRYIVFGSPRRLDLRVVCACTTPTRTLLDIWPPFPISIFGNSGVDERSVENLTAAVKHRDRTSEIYIPDINGPALEKLAAVMHEPLPALTDLYLRSTDESVPVLPETFLGGFAPRLQSFILLGIPFPSFPKFVLSATHIIHLHLFNIPNSGYISPDAMATCLAALPNLKFLDLGFRSPLSRPLQVALLPRTCAVLPALASLSFKGASEYFEDLLARTHIPLLKSLYMQFFMDLIFDLPRIHQFIDRTEGLRPLGHAWVMFDLKTIAIKLGPPTRIQLAILCEERDWQLSSLTHVCYQHLPLSSVEQLSVCEFHRGTSLHWKDDMDSSQWLELFHRFIAVRSLYVAKQFVPFVTAALQELTGERTMEVLPVLNSLFLEGLEPSGPMQEAIKPFVSARQLSDHPVVIHSETPPLHWITFRDV
jgi:hypothetical protein